MKIGERYFGRDEYFNSVIVKSKKNLSGMIKNVKILEGNHNTLFGEVPQIMIKIIMLLK